MKITGNLRLHHTEFKLDPSLKEQLGTVYVVSMTKTQVARRMSNFNLHLHSGDFYDIEIVGKNKTITRSKELHFCEIDGYYFMLNEVAYTLLIEIDNC